jgi:UDP-N-acetylglucosamine--N-acetylmuramyl-(pentapeptide) pyrophosphoryl-undecaprenol N-acetylglucosamine transferase
MDNQTIAFVAGRSGGHIIPALTIAQHIKAGDSNTQILFFTTAHPLDQAIIKKQGSIINKHIALKLGNVPFFNIFKILVFIINFSRAFFKSLSVLREYKPQRVIGMGGYISIPVCLAARMMRIPVHLYDLDAKPGKATRFLAKYAERIFVCFEQALQFLPADRCEITAYPIRFGIGARDLKQEIALAQLGLHPGKKTIFINGGSQGSVFVNTCIREWLDLNPHLHSLIQIIHQTGSIDTTNWKSIYQDADIPAVVFTYKEDLAPCYAAADVIISRAGAGSLFEALFFNKPCVAIPLETASTSHQKDNARALSHKYPLLFNMLTEHEIKSDNMILFRVLNKFIYAQAHGHGLNKPGKPAHML